MTKFSEVDIGHGNLNTQQTSLKIVYKMTHPTANNPAPK